MTEADWETFDESWRQRAMAGAPTSAQEIQEVHDLQQRILALEQEALRLVGQLSDEDGEDGCNGVTEAALRIQEIDVVLSKHYRKLREIMP